MSTEETIVPADFAVPAGAAGEGMRLELLGPQHNDADYAAWTSSIDHIRATAGWAGRRWPHPMTLEQNLADLLSHEDRSARRIDFAYTVIEEATGQIVGCVYIKPARGGEHPVEALSWVRADRAGLDEPLTRVVDAWLRADWPFPAVGYRLGDVPTTIRTAAE